MISFSCDCGASYTVANHFAGKASRCKKCSNRITVPSANKELDWFAETASTLASSNNSVRPKHQTVSEARSVPPPLPQMRPADEVALSLVVFFSIIGFICVYGPFSIFAAFWLGWHDLEHNILRGFACWMLALPLVFALNCLGLKNGFYPVGILLVLVMYASNAIYYFS